MEKRSWRVFFIAIFIMLIIPFVVLGTFLHAITNGSFPLMSNEWPAFSNQSQEWSNFGSLLSGLFGLSSALATMITLGFAIYQANETLKRSDQQSRELKTEQEKQNNKIESHNKDIVDFHGKIINFYQEINEFNERVIKFNETQQKRDIFDRYRFHKEEFNRLLDDIIYDLDDFYGHGSAKITRRSELYYNIFPQNNFEYFTINSPQPLPGKPDILARILEYANGIFSWVTRDHEHVISDNVLNSIMWLRDSINLELTVTPNVNGEIINATYNKYIVSIDLFEEELNLLLKVSNRVLSFANRPPIENKYENRNPCVLKSNLFRLHEKISSRDTYSKEYTAYRHRYTPSEIDLFEIYRLARIFDKKFHNSLQYTKRHLGVFLNKREQEKTKDEARSLLIMIDIEILDLLSKNQDATIDGTSSNQLLSTINSLIRRAKSEFEN